MAYEFYTAQEFIEEYTGVHYERYEVDSVEKIHQILKEDGVETEDSPLWDYGLYDTPHVVENNINVALVLIPADYPGFDECRWFEKPHTK